MSVELISIVKLIPTNVWKAAFDKLYPNSPLDKAIKNTANKFSYFENVKEALYKWCESYECYNQVERLKIGRKTSIDQELVESFVTKGEFAPQLTDYKIAEQVVETFFASYLKELLKGEDGPSIIFESIKLTREQLEEAIKQTLNNGDVNNALDIEIKKFLRLKVEEENNWIVWKRKDNTNDPEYFFEVSFLIETGNVPIWIYEFIASRYIDGCICWNKTPELRLADEEIFIDGNYKALKEPKKIEPNESIKGFYKRHARAPIPGYNLEYLENGEIHIQMKYRFLNSQNDETLEIFLRQEKGTYQVIDSISEPPLLKSIDLIKAKQNGVITELEYLICSGIKPEDRFLALRGDEDIARNHDVYPSQLAVLETVNTKIRDL